MNLKDKLAALKKEAESIMPKVAEGDAEAMKRAAELADAIEETEAAIKAADEFAAKVKGIGAVGSKQPEGKVEAKTLGEFAAEGVRQRGIKAGDRFGANLGTFSKAAASPMVTPSGVANALADVQERLYEGPRRRLVVADLLGQETTTRSAVTYFVESDTVNGEVGYVAEGAKKPLVSFGDPTVTTDKVMKIAAVLKESDEMVDDLPWLASAIDNRGIYLVQLKEEDEILNGTGSGTALDGIMHRTGILTEQTASGESNVADAIFRAMTKIAQNSPFTADGIVVNPTDYQTLRLAKDSNNQYYGGGFFQGQYGNGGVTEQPPIWGLRTVVTPAIAAGTVLVGAFQQGASVIRRQGLTVEVANQNEDDFVNNRIAIRIEERLALAVRYPKAFCKVTVAAAA